MGEPPQCMTPSGCAPHPSSSALRQAGDLCERVSPLHVQLSDKLPCGSPRAALEVTPPGVHRGHGTHQASASANLEKGSCLWALHSCVPHTASVSPLKAGGFICLGRASGLHPHPGRGENGKPFLGLSPGVPGP